MPDAHQELREVLDGLEPAGFEELADADVRHLVTAIHAVREKHREDLARATEDALRHVPRLVRPAVRKIVGL